MPPVPEARYARALAEKAYGSKSLSGDCRSTRCPRSIAIIRSTTRSIHAGVYGSQFGHDFTRVRVHTDARAATSARALQAQAYTVGRKVVFGTGQYSPGTAAGRRLLAHELTHTVQQEGNSPREIQRQALPGASMLAQKMTLAELWNAVAVTSVGKKYLGELAVAKKQPPTLSWGAAPMRGLWDAGTNTITLNNVDYSLTDNEWKQVIAIEIGNAAQQAKFDEIRSDAKNNPPSREEFIAAIESIEFDKRLEVIKSYEAGEFCAPTKTPECPSIFDTSVKDFEEYITDPRGEEHREIYGTEWDEDYRKKYRKLHPGK
jgi:hypothetical protein